MFTMEMTPDKPDTEPAPPKPASAKAPESLR
jgi:hypothetical protein